MDNRTIYQEMRAAVNRPLIFYIIGKCSYDIKSPPGRIRPRAKVLMQRSIVHLALSGELEYNESLRSIIFVELYS